MQKGKPPGGECAGLLLVEIHDGASERAGGGCTGKRGLGGLDQVSSILAMRESTCDLGPGFRQKGDWVFPSGDTRLGGRPSRSPRRRSCWLPNRPGGAG